MCKKQLLDFKILSIYSYLNLYTYIYILTVYFRTHFSFINIKKQYPINFILKINRLMILHLRNIRISVLLIHFHI